MLLTRFIVSGASVAVLCYLLVRPVFCTPPVKWLAYSDGIAACIAESAEPDRSCTADVASFLDFMMTLAYGHSTTRQQVLDLRTACHSGCLHSFHRSMDPYLQKHAAESAVCPLLPNEELESTGLMGDLVDFACMQYSGVCPRVMAEALEGSDMYAGLIAKEEADSKLQWPLGEDMEAICARVQENTCCAPTWLRSMHALATMTCHPRRAGLLADLPARCSTLGFPLSKGFCDITTPEGTLVPLTADWMQSYMDPGEASFFERCQYQETPTAYDCSSSSAGQLFSIDGAPRRCFQSSCDLWCAARWIGNPDNDPASYGDLSAGDQGGMVWWVLSLVAAACLIACCWGGCIIIYLITGRGLVSQQDLDERKARIETLAKPDVVGGKAEDVPPEAPASTLKTPADKAREKSAEKARDKNAEGRIASEPLDLGKAASTKGTLLGTLSTLGGRTAAALKSRQSEDKEKIVALKHGPGGEAAPGSGKKHVTLLGTLSNLGGWHSRGSRDTHRVRHDLGHGDEMVTMQSNSSFAHLSPSASESGSQDGGPSAVQVVIPPVRSQEGRPPAA